MCIGEAGLDTIDSRDREHLRAAAIQEFPAYSFGVRANGDGLSWVVIDPPVLRAHHLRFTICRISPCFVVMSEDASGRRQLCSAQGVDDAMAFARHAADQAMLAATNAHPLHPVVQ